MFRPAASLMIAVAALIFSTGVAARTALDGGQAADQPCPTSRAEAAANNASGAAAPADPNSSADAASKSSGKTWRPRWRMLVPGVLKSSN